MTRAGSATSRFANFRKVAQTSAIGSGVWRDGQLARTVSAKVDAKPGVKPGARAVTAASYFLDGSRALDFESMLKEHAAEYQISRNPRDFLFEAIRANTSEAPNENDDTFTRQELLTFRQDLGMPVYATYTGKPHHVNHKADDPTRARGIIVDAHYNQSNTPLPSCPRCNTKTAARENRDVTGLFCRKCGALVKDEFVEILLAVDTKKDPDFAKGVRDGVLRFGSMGCTCMATECGVCSNVAYSKAEFCPHVRSKGSIWTRRSARDEWRRGSLRDVERFAREAGMKFVPADFVSFKLDSGFEARRAHEMCMDVVYEEYSRVPQPADPKAEHLEFIRAAGKGGSDASPDTLSVHEETHQLLRAAAAVSRGEPVPNPTKTNKPATGGKTAAPAAPAKKTKTAAKFFVVRVNGDETDTAAGKTIEEAVEAAMPDATDTLEVGEVEAMDAGAARLMQPGSWAPVDLAAHGFEVDSGAGEVSADVRVQAPPGEQVIVEPAPGEGGAPGMPGAPAIPGAPGAPGAPASIEQFTEDQMTNPPGGPGGAGPQMTPAELGILPPGAGKQSGTEPESKEAAKQAAAWPFMGAYGEWSTEVLPNMILLRDQKKQAALRVAYDVKTDKVAAADKAKAVLQSLAQSGFVATAAKYDATPGTKFAQVVEQGTNDIAEKVDYAMYPSITDGGQVDVKDAKDLRGKGQDDVQEGGETDADGARSEPGSDVLEDGASDSERRETSPGNLSSVEPKPLGDTQDGPKDPPKSVVQDIDLDFSTRGGALIRASGIGTRLAHADAPEASWTVVGARKNQLVVQGEDGTRLALSASDLEYWRSLEATADQAVSAYEAEVGPAFAEKVAQLRKEMDERVAQAEVAALQKLRRCIDIVARRFIAGIEELPIREGIIAALNTRRVLGRDPSTNRDVHYAGMRDQLASYMAEEAIQLAHGDHINALLDRAASLMERSDDYLDGAEADVQHLRIASPLVTESMVQSDEDAARALAFEEAARRAASKRAEAVRGNTIPQLPETEDAGYGEVVAGDTQASKIRNALRGTRLAQRVEEQL